MTGRNILEKEAIRADTFAGYMYDGDFGNPLHSYSSYFSMNGDYVVVHIGVDDPIRENMYCWTVVGEIHLEGVPRYFVRLPQSERSRWVNGKFDGGVRELPCPQDVAGMLETMETYRKEFLRTGYMEIVNKANTKILEALD